MAIVTFMKNGLSNEEMEIAKSELKKMFDEENNVFTGIVFKWREVRGKEGIGITYFVHSLSLKVDLFS